MTDEMKEVIYLAISAMILSVVLGFVAIMGTVQRNIAEARNNEVAGQVSIEQNNKYDKYNKRELIGEEVVECIREYYDSGITIYVRADGIAQDTYNLSIYTDDSKKKYFSVADGSYLMSWFTGSATKRYKSYLVYNTENPITKFNNMMNKFRATNEYVSGTLKQKCDKLDELDTPPPSGSEVTGIIIIDEATL